jgi:hypothetical protein
MAEHEVALVALDALLGDSECFLMELSGIAAGVRLDGRRSAVPHEL